MTELENISPEVQEVYEKYKLFSDKKKEELKYALEQDFFERLLTKPNMKIKDKEGIQKSLDLLESQNMDTPKNLQRLDKIIYTNEYIDIGGTKRARKDLIAEPKGNKIFQHGNTTFFRSGRTTQEQNKILTKQGMAVPGTSHFEASLKALPGRYPEGFTASGKEYIGGRILAFITNMSQSSHCNEDGELDYHTRDVGYRLALHVENDRQRFYMFQGYEGMFGISNSGLIAPIRPIYK